MQSRSNAKPSAPNPPLSEPGLTPHLKPRIPLEDYILYAGNRFKNSQRPHSQHRSKEGKDASHFHTMAQDQWIDIVPIPPLPALLNLWQTATLFGLKEKDVVALVDCGRLTPLFREGVRMIFAKRDILAIAQESKGLREITPFPVRHPSIKRRKRSTNRPKSPPSGRTS